MSALLHSIVRHGYGNQPQQEKDLASYGYVRDNELSNGHRQVYYNKDTNKLINNANSSQSPSDLLTNTQMLFGKLKDTSRYKEEHNSLEKAPKKCNNPEVLLTGHSLGGSLASHLAGKNDKVVSLNGYIAPFEKVPKNETHYRSFGDIVSLFGAKATNNKTIHPVKYDRSKGLVDFGLLTHSSNPLRDQKIYV